MTVVEATNRLFEYFGKNDTFVQNTSSTGAKKDDDFHKLLLVSEDLDFERAAVNLALIDLQAAGLIKKETIGQRCFWVLHKPIAAYEQTVTIDAPLAMFLEKILNGFCEQIQDKTDVCNATQITTKDLRNLCYICSHFMSQKETGSESSKE